MYLKHCTKALPPKKKPTRFLLENKREAELESSVAPVTGDIPAPENHITTALLILTRATPSAAQQVRNGSYESSIYMNPELWPNNSHGVTSHASPSCFKSSRGAAHVQLPKPMSISRTTSEPSPSMRRFQIIDSFFTKPPTGVGVKAGVSSTQNTPALTPTLDLRMLSHSPAGSHSSSGVYPSRRRGNTILGCILSKGLPPSHCKHCHL